MLAWKCAGAPPGWVCSPQCPLGHAKGAGGNQQLVVEQGAGKTEADLQSKTHQSTEKPPKVKASLLDKM